MVLLRKTSCSNPLMGPLSHAIWYRQTNRSLVLSMQPYQSYESHSHHWLRYLTSLRARRFAWLVDSGAASVLTVEALGSTGTLVGTAVMLRTGASVGVAGRLGIGASVGEVTPLENGASLGAIGATLPTPVESGRPLGSGLDETVTPLDRPPKPLGSW